MSKCLMHGWFLPFTPSLHEYGAWKHHYIACCLSLDLENGEDSIAVRFIRALMIAENSAIRRCFV